MLRWFWQKASLTEKLKFRTLVKILEYKNFNPCLSIILLIFLFLIYFISTVDCILIHKISLLLLFQQMFYYFFQLCQTNISIFICKSFSIKYFTLNLLFKFCMHNFQFVIRWIKIIFFENKLMNKYHVVLLEIVKVFLHRNVSPQIFVSHELSLFILSEIIFFHIIWNTRMQRREWF